MFKKTLFLLFVLSIFASPIYAAKDASIIKNILAINTSFEKVIHKFPKSVKNYKELYYLLLIETAVIESSVGKDVDCQGNYGHYQIRGTTAKFLLNDVKKENPSLYKSLMEHYDNSKNLKENMIFNLDFSTALCLLYYSDKIKNPNTQLNTLETRAKTWKILFNTIAGSGTTQKYISKNKILFPNLTENLF